MTDCDHWFVGKTRFEATIDDDGSWAVTVIDDQGAFTWTPENAKLPHGLPTHPTCADLQKLDWLNEVDLKEPGEAD